MSMLLSMEDLSFLDRTTVTTKDGGWLAKDDLSEDDRKRLLALEELKYWSSGTHLISNYEDLKK